MIWVVKEGWDGRCMVGQADLGEILMKCQLGWTMWKGWTGLTR